MEEVDFSNVAAAQEWLEGQTVEVCCAISSRAALRFCANLKELDDGSFPRVAITSFRAVLTSAVRGLGRTADLDWLKGSALSAAHFAQAAHISVNLSVSAGTRPFSARNYVSAACYAASVAAADVVAGSTAAGFAGRAAGSAASFDAVQTNLTDYHIPLWSGADVPPVIQDAHERFLDRLNQDRAIWGFWHDWYLAMWEGTFRDWDLATEVAKIPEDVWEEGPEEVALAIRNLEAQRLIEVAGINEGLVLDEDTSKFDVVPHAQSNQQILEAAVSRSEDALEDVFV